MFTPGIWLVKGYQHLHFEQDSYSIATEIKRLKRHDDAIKWKHFPRYWLFVRGIHRSPVNSLHKGQWRGALMFSLICVRISDWVNNRQAGDLRRHPDNYDVIVIVTALSLSNALQAINLTSTGSLLTVTKRLSQWNPINFSAFKGQTILLQGCFLIFLASNPKHFERNALFRLH